MTSTPSPLRRCTPLVAAALLAACASAPEIQHDTNPTADFASYRTFAYFSPLATDRAGYESVLTSRLKAATRRMMESKGYVYNETSPDLLVNFFANVQEKQEVRSWPSIGYYGYRYPWYGSWGVSTVDTVTYREGTLTVDLVESRRKVLVWQATAEGRVSEEARKNPGAAIDATVTEMMASLPAAGGK
jgi:hypothetical protein